MQNKLQKNPTNFSRKNFKGTDFFLDFAVQGFYVKTKRWIHTILVTLKAKCYYFLLNLITLFSMYYKSYLLRIAQSILKDITLKFRIYFDLVKTQKGSVLLVEISYLFVYTHSQRSKSRIRR